MLSRAFSALILSIHDTKWGGGGTIDQHFRGAAHVAPPLDPPLERGLLEPPEKSEEVRCGAKINIAKSNNYNGMIKLISISGQLRVRCGQ